MALSVLKFVDSIAASPTTRLDLNDGTIFRTLADGFDAPPPRLRRAMSQNAMSDGGFVSSSQYEMRIVKATLYLNRSTQDLNAAQLQLLARELDRADNYLMFQPNGLTKPVFFVTKRSDFTSVREVPSPDAALRAMECEVLAEPFALGLRETLGPYTVNNDPAAGSNGLFFDVTGVIGDVMAPVMLTDATRLATRAHLAVRQNGTPSDLVFFAQAESVTAFFDTANPGGGPDADMSGTGTNNFMTTDFATDDSMTTRLLWEVVTSGTSDAVRLASAGTYRVLACVRRSDGTSVMRAQALGANGGAAGQVVTIPQSTARQIVDLGPLPTTPALHPGGYASQATMGDMWVSVLAERVSGSGTLDWDYLAILPADESTLIWGVAGIAAGTAVIDGPNEAMYYAEDGPTLLAGGGKVAPGVAPSVSGSFPKLVPGRTNRFYYLWSFNGVHIKSETASITAYYHPRYLNVRPSAT